MYLYSRLTQFSIYSLISSKSGICFLVSKEWLNDIFLYPPWEPWWCGPADLFVDFLEMIYMSFYNFVIPLGYYLTTISLYYFIGIVRWGELGFL